MIIEYITLFLIIYGWTSLFVINKQERNAYEFVVSCSSIIITIFLFSVFQKLNIGLLVVSTIGFVGTIYSVKQIFSSRELIAISFQRFFSLTIVFILAFFASWGTDYWAWDEFSHWGTQVEFLFVNENLHTDSKILLFPDYIPGMSLWRYFGRYLLQSIGTSGSYFMNYILMFSCIYAVSYSKSIIKWLLTSFIVFCGLLVFFQSLVYSLYADPVQSLLLLCTLKIASEENPENFIYLLLITVTVVLTKHVGFIFSFFITFYYLFLHLFAYKTKPLLVFKKTGIIFLSAALFYIIWSGYLNYYSISVSRLDNTKIFNGNFLDSLMNFWINIIAVLNSKFPHALYIKPTLSIDALTNGIPLWAFALIIFIIDFFLAFLPTQNRKVNWFNFLFFLISCVLYLLFLAFINVTFAMDGDIYSHSRYFSVVLFSFFFLQTLTVLNGLYVRMIGAGLLVTGLYLLIAPPLNTVISFEKRPIVLMSNKYNEKALLVKNQVSSTSIIWYINTGMNTDNILAYYIFRSKMIPWEVLNWWEGSGIYLGDSLQNQKEAGNRVALFAEKICKADIIFVDDVKPEFWSQYSELFDKSNKKLYKVKRIDDKKCHAISIE